MLACRNGVEKRDFFPAANAQPMTNRNPHPGPDPGPIAGAASAEGAGRDPARRPRRPRRLKPRYPVRRMIEDSRLAATFDDGYSVHRAATGRGFRVIKVRRHGTPRTEPLHLV